jgi:hypothetical protein
MNIQGLSDLDLDFNSCHFNHNSLLGCAGNCNARMPLRITPNKFRAGLRVYKQVQRNECIAARWRSCRSAIVKPTVRFPFFSLVGFPQHGFPLDFPLLSYQTLET